MIKLFTHTDLDGIGCAVIAKMCYEESLVDITYCNYDDVDAKVEEFLPSAGGYSKIFITDISIADNLASYIDENFDNFVLLDHHPSALKLNKYSWCSVKIEDKETKLKTSGTEMFFKQLIELDDLKPEDTMIKFVELVRNYDTWRWSAMGEDGLICKQVNDLFHIYGKNKFTTWCVSEISDCVFPRLYAEDSLILSMKQKEIDDYVSRKNNELTIMELCGKKCGFVFAETFFSELGNRLCVLNPEIDFVAMIDITSCIVSYRTIRKDIDLGKDIASLFGGGGHPKAAGSQFNKSLRLKVIEQIFCI